MFDLVTRGFKDATLALRGKGRLTEENIAPALKHIEKSLLDADVDLQVTRDFLNNIKNQCLNKEVVLKSKSFDQKVTAEDHFVKICHDGLVDLLGGQAGSESFIKNKKGPTVVLLVGLQGAGKTTHAAKLAKYLSSRKEMRPLLVAADVYRPAAREQLKILANKIDVPFFTVDDSNNAVEIARQGLEYARREWLDLVIIDTAGRLTIDEALMKELQDIKVAVEPQNILLVIDAMIGQDAVRTASTFDSNLGLTGVILTKLDGDTRGGAALSVKKVTGKEIVFAGTGESLDSLEEFRSEGMAGRILGMGDIVGLMSDFEKVVEKNEVESRATRIMEGHFDFNDFLEMMGTLGKMGPMKDLISKTPMASKLSDSDMSKIEGMNLNREKAMVLSMTRAERENPDLLLIAKSPSARSRIARIAKGSANTEKGVKDLVERFGQMRQMVLMMSGMAGGGGGGLFSGLPGLGQLNKLANMAKMAKMMGGAGGFPTLPGMGGLPGGGLSTAEIAEINRMRKRKKEENLRKNKKR